MYQTNNVISSDFNAWLESGDKITLHDLELMETVNILGNTNFFLKSLFQEMLWIIPFIE